MSGRLSRFAKEVGFLNRQEMKRTGTHVLYTPRRRCSCLGKTRATDIACRVCGGFGWFWLAEDERITRAIVQSATFHRDLVAQGLVQPGDMVIQFDRPPMNLAPEDRIRLDPHFLFTFQTASEAAVLTRGEGAADTLPYRISKIFSIDRSDPRTGDVTVFQEGHYSFVRGTNVVTWAGDPALGEVPYQDDQYSVSYLADYDWVVTQPSGQVGVGPVGIQGKVVCSRRMRSARREDEMAEDIPVPEEEIRSLFR